MARRECQAVVLVHVPAQAQLGAADVVADAGVVVVRGAFGQALPDAGVEPPAVALLFEAPGGSAERHFSVPLSRARFSRRLLVVKPRHFMLRSQLLLRRRRDRRVVREDDAVRALAAGERLQSSLVVVELGERHLATDRHAAGTARLRAGDLAALAREVAGQIADRFLGTKRTIVLGGLYLPWLPRHLGSWALVAMAFGGGLAVTAVVYVLGQVQGTTRIGLMLLAGIAVNALAGAELAIVTPIAGTTRDKVQQTIQIEGVPLHVIDTAGLRDSDDEVERIGIARAWSEIEGADAVLFLHDLSRMDQPDYLAADAAVTASMQQKIPASVPVIDVWNKTDCTSTAVAEAAGSGAVNRRSVRISARTGDGLEALRRILLEVAGWQSAPEGVYIARARHVQALAQVDAHLEQAAAQLLIPSPALDLLAEELRLAQNALGAITGEFSSDDLLGVIFSSFCIGK